MNNYVEQNAVPDKIINSFDIDGVIFMDKYDGVYPGDRDVIITGRSNEERSETEAMLKSKNITNELYLNPTPFESKSRKDSGRHKGRTLFVLGIVSLLNMSYYRFLWSLKQQKSLFGQLKNYNV